MVVVLRTIIWARAVDKWWCKVVQGCSSNSKWWWAEELCSLMTIWCFSSNSSSSSRNETKTNLAMKCREELAVAIVWTCPLITVPVPSMISRICVKWIWEVGVSMILISPWWSIVDSPMISSCPTPDKNKTMHSRTTETLGWWTILQGSRQTTRCSINSSNHNSKTKCSCNSSCSSKKPRETTSFRSRIIFKCKEVRVRHKWILWISSRWVDAITCNSKCNSSKGCRLSLLTLRIRLQCLGTSLCSHRVMSLNSRKKVLEDAWLASRF